VKNYKIRESKAAGIFLFSIWHQSVRREDQNQFLWG